MESFTLSHCPALEDATCSFVSRQVQKTLGRFDGVFQQKMEMYVLRILLPNLLSFDHALNPVFAEYDILDRRNDEVHMVLHLTQGI